MFDVVWPPQSIDHSRDVRRQPSVSPVDRFVSPGAGGAWLIGVAPKQSKGRLGQKRRAETVEGEISDFRSSSRIHVSNKVILNLKAFGDHKHAELASFEASKTKASI